MAKKPPDPALIKKLVEVINQDPVHQTEFFLKSFIFVLGPSWKDVPNLCKAFQDTAKTAGEHKMTHIEAADFLQHHGVTRTATERRAEMEDIDMNKDGSISFIEYLLLHYKCLVLAEWYKTRNEEPDLDLTKNGVGIIGVGQKLLEELFTAPGGLSDALIKAIEEFSANKRKRDAQVAKLQKKADEGGVKGEAAKNELLILTTADKTEMNKIELSLGAAQRLAEKALRKKAEENRKKGEALLKEEEGKQEAEAKAKKEASKKRLAEKSAMFGSSKDKEAAAAEKAKAEEGDKKVPAWKQKRDAEAAKQNEAGAAATGAQTEAPKTPSYREKKEAEKRAAEEAKASAEAEATKAKATAAASAKAAPEIDENGNKKWPTVHTRACR